MKHFTNDHEWINVDGDTATVGITRFAADALGDLVFVDVKPTGTTMRPQDSIAVVESVKAASDIYAPVSGEIVTINPRIAAEPELVNADPEGEGWLFTMRLSDPSELKGLLDAAAYAALVGAQGGQA